ncbi:MAG: putative toxin-antitoxin system toxin component, PIN family [Nitrospirae bacterium]|nr:putative toxin-antitoxin system toxin component, PIN family [Nitrospirota bacterium]
MVASGQSRNRFAILAPPRLAGQGRAPGRSPATRSRVFLDTNVLFSAFATLGVCHRLLAHAALRTFQSVVSPQVLDELKEHLPKVGHAGPEADARIANIRRFCEVVDAEGDPPRVCRDPDDDAILAAAVKARVDILVTGDKDLLVLGTHEGIEIVTPAELLIRTEQVGTR